MKKLTAMRSNNEARVLCCCIVISKTRRQVATNERVAQDEQRCQRQLHARISQPTTYMQSTTSSL